MYVLRQSQQDGEWLRGRALAWGARDRGFDSRLPEILLLDGETVSRSPLEGKF